MENIQEYQERLRVFVTEGQNRAGSLGKFASEVTSKLPDNQHVTPQLLHRWQSKPLKEKLKDDSLYKIGVALGADPQNLYGATEFARNYLEGRDQTFSVESKPSPVINVSLSMSLDNLPAWMETAPINDVSQVMPALLKAASIGLKRLNEKGAEEFKA